MAEKKLFRKDGKIFGVCAGLAEYLVLDVTVIRIAFILGLFAGVSILVYPILALVMPKG